MNETKKEILTASLELFSKKGYSAVSIRDICKIVQIKESSVYYHFKNKQAILEELLIQFEDIATGMMQQLEESLSKPVNPEKSNFYKGICDIFFEEYLMDDFCNNMNFITGYTSRITCAIFIFMMRVYSGSNDS